MSGDKLYLSVEQALALLPEGDHVHTFVAGGFAVIGCDYERASVVDLITNAEWREVAGDTARRMGHGLVIPRRPSPLFIETDAQKLDAFDPPQVPA